MRSYLRVLLFALVILVLAIAVPLPAQSAASLGARTGIALSASTPPLLSFTSPYTYYFPIVAFNKTLAISGVSILQGTSLETYGFTTRSREAVLRAFVSVTPVGTVDGVNARLYVMNGGTEVGTVDSNTITAPSMGASDMSRTLNFDLPAGLVQPGYSYYIQLDPNRAWPDWLIPSRRYPQSGTVPLNAVYARPLQVVIVPVNYLPAGVATSTWPAPNYASYLEWMPEKVLPVPSVSYAIHTPVSYVSSNVTTDLTTANGWSLLLYQLSQIHWNEDQAGNYVYYGIVNTVDAYADRCAWCYTGLGWIGDHKTLPTAVGWSGYPNGNNVASETMTHEIGHNFGREHVLCMGNEALPDPNYPYPGGSIGVWGMDTDTHTLYNPASYADYMSYCPNAWTSDYTYAGIKSYREAGVYLPVRAAGAPTDTLYVSGTISPDGVVTFRPIYRVTATISNLGEGTHVLDIVDQGGQVLASYRFTPTRIADSNGASGFGFSIPVLDGAAGLRVSKDGKVLGEKTVSGAPSAANFRTLSPSAQREAGGSVLRWAAVTHPTAPVSYSVSISRDRGATWQVLALDLASPQLTVPAGVDLANTVVEIQASDGIHVVTQTMSIGQIP